MWRATILQFVLIVVIPVNTNGNVITVTKCKRSDVDCITSSSEEVLRRFADGIPEYHVTRMDPMFFEYVDISYPNLKLLARNVTARGFRGCNIRRMEIKESTMLAKLLCNLTLDGLYEMDGHLLMFPVQGKGKMFADIKNVHFNGEADVVEVIGKDGEKHWKVKSYRHSFELTDKAHLELENLSTNNLILKKSFKYFLDNHPNTMVTAIGDHALGEVASVAFVNVNHFFGALPLKELVLD